MKISNICLRIQPESLRINNFSLRIYLQSFLISNLQLQIFPQTLKTYWEWKIISPQSLKTCFQTLRECFIAIKINNKWNIHYFQRILRIYIQFKLLILKTPKVYNFVIGRMEKSSGYALKKLKYRGWKNK